MTEMKISKRKVHYRKYKIMGKNTEIYHAFEAYINVNSLYVPIYACLAWCSIQTYICILVIIFAAGGSPGSSVG